ncbi:hypothetical protein [uncultured Massilia sp.]|uniref:hypothetical protein n=1 Tax=uncultured Massilia sp. TaxID=169973 RepID=UPI0025EA1CB9|nr:hypothetical protein [uncultured Massilia sp.]
MGMPRYLSSLFACLAAALLAACVAAPIQPGSYPLRPQQSATLARNVKITYDSFSDSRCPPNVQCIWAGRLAFRFLVDGPGGQEEITLGPDQPSAAPRALRGARIALDPAALPPARAAGNARPGDVIPVTLMVRTP